MTSGIPYRQLEDQPSWLVQIPDDVEILVIVLAGSAYGAHHRSSRAHFTG